MSEVVGEEAEAARRWSTSRAVEPGGGWEDDCVVVVFVVASSDVKMESGEVSAFVVLGWLSSDRSSKRMWEGMM